MSSNIEDKSSVGSRWREERDRLRLSRADVALACERTPQGIGEYERGVSMPGGQALIGFAGLGADINYILTGIRTLSVDQVAEEHPEYTQKQKEETATEAGALSPRDRIWLEIGQQLSEDDRTRLQEIGASLVSAKYLKKTKNE
ncbi:helix-turn-helix domain-containing protein [Sedimenticola selenatireducens]|uniref:Helix-turn-helix domain-containing protein n=1 Tax=Sedimenticola selenatireducens TaxID=191960 RepID=A0A557S0H7_9GAMM|nr:helix-turn-helix transcriptional regulator [Sedimenticola selenatireducens]TVO70879.1 helix-turn-helix domain-containing protein [Sedimenticola selenatireducens]